MKNTQRNEELEDYSEHIEKLEANLNKNYNSYLESINNLNYDKPKRARLNGLKVNVYGVLNNIEHLASITEGGYNELIIKPYDHNILKNIVEAINISFKDYSVISQKEKIIIKFPELTEAKRIEFVKIISERTNNAKINIRNLKRKCISFLKHRETIGKNEIVVFTEEINNMSNKYMKMIDEIKNTKESSILKKYE